MIAITGSLHLDGPGQASVDLKTNPDEVALHLHSCGAASLPYPVRIWAWRLFFNSGLRKSRLNRLSQSVVVYDGPRVLVRVHAADKQGTLRVHWFNALRWYLFSR